MLLRLLYVIDQAASLGDILDETRQRRGLESIARCLVDDLPRTEVDGKDVTGLDLFDVVADFQGRQADVDGVAVKDAGEAGRNDDGNARSLDAIGACSRDEPQPKLWPPTMMSPSLTLPAKVSSMSTMQCVANSFGSKLFK